VPSQVPLVPQLAAPCSAHWFSGSWPAGTSMHEPADPWTAHDLHVPPQSLAQQTPCAQKPESQSPATAQVAPTGLRPQLPEVHMFDRHCVLSVQVVRQSPTALQR